MASRGSARDDETTAPGSLSAAEVAGMLGVSRQAVQARARRGSLRAYKVEGEWRIPAEVATALVAAEHHRGLSAGSVRTLPVGGPRPDPDGSAVLEVLEARLATYEARLAEQNRRMEEVLAHQHEQLAARDAELAVLRAETVRLRRAVVVLVDGDAR